MKYLAILGVAAFAIACDSPTSPNTAASIAPASRVANAVVTNDRVETLTGAPNNCNGDVLILTATWHTVFAVTFDGAGGFHLKQHVNIQGQGSDAGTGVDYVVTDVANSEFNGSFGFENTYTESYNLIAKGKAPNAWVQIDDHITVTPNGDVSSYHSNFRIVCQ
ncbi:MAG TPA: hypothetical protein VHT23_12950 [Gemmatimonadaceae bacterium]|nr:hypothetical protein [Gemmatimonadaceae bacterium]